MRNFILMIVKITNNVNNVHVQKITNQENRYVNI